MFAPSCPPDRPRALRHRLDRVRRALRAAWQALRQLSGDDAYERYLEHHCRHHAGLEPLDRRTFWCGEVERRWRGGAQRCC